MNVRTTIKRIVERSMIVTGVPTVSRRRRRRDVLVLAYHNIVPDGEPSAGDGSLHLAQRAFGRQLDILQKTHDVISVQALIDGLPESAGRPRAVITFDDAYRGAMTAGVAELRRRNLPATVFVTPAYVGGLPFWWDVLTPASVPSLDPALRHAALTTDAGKDRQIVARARRERRAITTQLPANATCASDAELAAALEHPGLTYGSHTWSHPNLTQLTPDELTTELVAPQEWLRRYGDRVVSAITYPYGCANETVWTAAHRAGYALGFMIDGGWLETSQSSRYAIPRLNIPANVSADGFALRIAGVVNA